MPESVGEHHDQILIMEDPDLLIDCFLGMSSKSFIKGILQLSPIGRNIVGKGNGVARLLFALSGQPPTYLILGDPYLGV